jgi:hypothetical protein
MSYNADFIQTEIDYLKDKSKRLKKRRAKIKDQIEQLEEELFDLKSAESAKSGKKLPLPECTASSESIVSRIPQKTSMSYTLRPGDELVKSYRLDREPAILPPYDRDAPPEGTCGSMSYMIAISNIND